MSFLMRLTLSSVALNRVCRGVDIALLLVAVGTVRRYRVGVWAIVRIVRVAARIRVRRASMRIRIVVSSRGASRGPVCRRRVRVRARVRLIGSARSVRRAGVAVGAGIGLVRLPVGIGCTNVRIRAAVDRRFLRHRGSRRGHEKNRRHQNGLHAAPFGPSRRKRNGSWPGGRWIRPVPLVGRC